VGVFLLVVLLVQFGVARALDPRRVGFEATNTDVVDVWTRIDGDGWASFPAAALAVLALLGAVLGIRRALESLISLRVVLCIAPLFLRVGNGGPFLRRLGFLR